MDLLRNARGGGLVLGLFVWFVTSAAHAQNTPPIADAGPDRTILFPQSLDDRLAINLSGIGTDADGDALTYSWNAIAQSSGEEDTEVALTGANTATPTWTLQFPDEIWPGSRASEYDVTLTLTVSDGQSQDTDTMALAVRGVNLGILADPGQDLVVDAGDNVELDGRASQNQRGGPLSYSWEQVGGTASEQVNLTGASTSVAAFEAPPLVLPASRQSALLIFRLTVTGSGASDSKYVTVRVNGVPEAVAGPDQSVGAGATVTLDSSGTQDVQGRNLTYSWSADRNNPVAVTLVGASSTTASFTAPAVSEFSGASVSLVFELTVNSGAGQGPAGSRVPLVDTDRVTITVNNNPPVANAGMDQSVGSADPVTLMGTAADEDTGGLSYRWAQINPSAESMVTLTDEDTATATFTAPPVQTQTELIFELTVTDNIGQVSTDEVRVVVLSQLTPMAGADQEVNVEAENVTLSAAGSSSARPNSTLTYSWAPDANNPVSVTLADASSAMATFTAPAVASVLTFILTVSDGTEMATDRVVITVNGPPTANAGANIEVSANTTVTLNGTGSSDPEGGVLTYAWTQDAGDLERVTLQSADTASATFVAPQVVTTTTLTFMLTVTDDSRAAAQTSESEVQVTITGNRAPLAAVGSDFSAEGGERITLSAQFSDPDNDTLTHEWSFIGATVADPNHSLGRRPVDVDPVTTGGPFQMSTSPMTTFTLARLTESVVELTFRYTVSDGLFERTDELVITALTPPISVEAFGANYDSDTETYTQTVGEIVVLQARVDPLSSGVEYSWSDQAGLQELQAFNSGSPTNQPYVSGAAGANAQFVVPADQARITFILRATDAAGNSDFTSIVVRGNSPPIADAGSSTTVNSGVVVTLDGSNSTDDHTDSSSLMYDWTSPSGVTLSANDQVQATFTAPNSDQDLIFMLTVTDEFGLMSAPAMTTITVNSTATNNTAPIADAGPDQTVTRPQRNDNGTFMDKVVALDGSGSSDPDGNPLSYSWEQSSSDSRQVSVDRGSTMRPFFDVPTDLEHGERLTFTLTVSDGLVTGSDQVVITLIDNRNNDVNETVAPELARQMTASTLKAVTGRINMVANTDRGSASQSSSLQDQLAITLTGMSDENGNTQDLKRSLSNQSFSYTVGTGSGLSANGNGGTGGSGRLSAWGSTEYRDMDGDDRQVNWDGDMFSAHAGLDMRLRSNLLAGVAVSWFDAEIDFKAELPTTNTNEDSIGIYESEMVSVHPYLSWFEGTSTLWVSIGYGEGNIDIETRNARLSTDSTLQTVAAGGRWQLPFSNETTRLDLKGEAWTTEFEVDERVGDLNELEAEAHRIRVALELTHTEMLETGGLFEPWAELGLRYDGGDGDTGGGVVLASGMRYGQDRLRFEVDGSILLAHSGNSDEWTVGASLGLAPQAHGRGLSLTLGTGWGGAAQSAEQIWQEGALDALRHDLEDGSLSRQLNFTAELGYGLLVDSSRILMTPFARLDSVSSGEYFELGASFDHGHNQRLTVEAFRDNQGRIESDTGLWVQFDSGW